jgi:hypothetical protein
MLDAAGLAGLLGLVLAMHGWHDFDPFLYHGGFLLAALAAAALILAVVHPHTRLGAVLSAPPLRWIGQRSYGIYLWHWPVMALSRPGIDVHLSTWILVPAQITATVVLAALSYRYVEMPIRGRPAPSVAAWRERHRPHAQRGIAAAATLLAGAAVLAGTLAPGAPSRSPVLAPATRAALASPQPAPTPRRPPSAVLAATGGVPRPVRPALGPARGPVLAVGASVMEDAAPALERQLGAKVDAAVGRQPGVIIDRLAAYRAAGALPPNVVVQIGDNGPFWGSDQARLRQVLRGVARVVLVNIRQRTSWEGQVNGAVVAVARAWAQATVADWHSASANAELLWDGAHPKPAGQSVYARTVGAALGLRPAPARPSRPVAPARPSRPVAPARPSLRAAPARPSRPVAPAGGTRSPAPSG